MISFVALIQSCDGQFVVLLCCFCLLSRLFCVFVVILWLACRNVLMYCLFVYFSVVNVLAIICTVFLSCNVVILVIYQVNIAIKARGLASKKKGSTYHFFLKCPVPSFENGSCYFIIRCYVYCIVVCFCCTSVFLLFPTYSWRLFFGLSLYPGFVFSQSIYDFWTSVYFCCLYLTIQNYRLSWVVAYKTMPNYLNILTLTNVNWMWWI